MITKTKIINTDLQFQPSHANISLLSIACYKTYNTIIYLCLYCRSLSFLERIQFERDVAAEIAKEKRMMQKGKADA